jgi:hypothetical protein
LVTKGEKTNAFSHVNLATDLSGSSLVSFSNHFSHTPAGRPDDLSSAGDAMGSGNVDAMALSVGGGISGLVLALTAGAAVFFLIRKKRRDQEVDIDVFDENTSDMPDSMLSMTSIDHYVSEENPEQVQAGLSTNFSSLSHADYLIRSHLHE